MPGKILIAYWSATGNTARMAGLIAEGVADTGCGVVCCRMEDTTVEEALEAGTLMMGAPPVDRESLEGEVVEPFVAGVERLGMGKRVGLFGSYGWGRGRYMDEWAERMRRAGVELLADPLLVQEMPSGVEEETECRDYGRMAGRAALGMDLELAAKRM